MFNQGAEVGPYIGMYSWCPQRQALPSFVAILKYDLPPTMIKSIKKGLKESTWLPACRARISFRSFRLGAGSPDGWFMSTMNFFARKSA